MRESNNVWKYIKPALETRGQWWRIESPIVSGIPDVYGILRGKSYWIELKFQDRMKEGLGTTKIQRLWHRKFGMEGGTSFVLARVAHRLYLVPGLRVTKTSSVAYWEAEAVFKHDIRSATGKQQPFPVGLMFMAMEGYRVEGDKCRVFE